MVKPRGTSASTSHHMLTVRITTELLEAIDRAVEQAQAERPGAHVQRSDIVRECLGRGLLTKGAEHGAAEASNPDVGVPPRGTNWGVWIEEGEGGASAQEREAAAGRLEAELCLSYGLRSEPRGGHPRTVDRAVVRYLLDQVHKTLPTQQDRQAFSGLLHSGPGAILDALAELVRRGGIEGLGPNRLTALGQLVSLKVRKRVLADVLDACEWSLGWAAESLGMRHGSGPLLRMIHEVGLDDEYEGARADGRVRRGPRPSGK